MDRWAALGEPTPPLADSHQSCTHLSVTRFLLQRGAPHRPPAPRLPCSRCFCCRHSFSTCWPPSPLILCPPPLAKSNSPYSSFTVLVRAAMGLLDLILPPPQKKKTGFAFGALRQVVLSLQGLLHCSLLWDFLRETYNAVDVANNSCSFLEQEAQSCEAQIRFCGSEVCHCKSHS